MTTLHVQIASLPQELTYDEAVEAAYREDLDWIEEKLRQNLSVLVECDKQLANYIYKALRRRFRSSGTRRLRLLSGHQQPSPEGGDQAMGANQTMTQRLLEELREAIYSSTGDSIYVMTHLDVLTTTTRSGLTAESREAAAIMYENPDLVFLGFRDPAFEIPAVIEKVFTARHSIIGISRDRLPSLILQREARKFGVEEFNPYALYKYVSGLNAVRCRQVMGQIADRLDFDPAAPEAVDGIYEEIRRLTLLGDLEVPHVDLEGDIGGYGEVKDKIQNEILQLLAMKEGSRTVEEMRSIEEIIPKGMIFWGPPGTGKTFFAKAIATALNATVSIVSGPELKSKWVGESEENLRRIFNQARRSAPALIIFDELDSFAAARGTYTGSGVEHSMVNQLLTEMDGFRKEELVFVIGTTNFMESLDPALLRPGRFELGIQIPYPDKDDRRSIFEIYRDKFRLNLTEEMMDYVVERTNGYVDPARGIRFSGDHCYAICRALKREALRRGDLDLEFERKDVDHAIGDRKKNRPQMKDAERRTVAIHEAGHAVVAYVLPHCPTVERISIAAGEEEDALGALGYVLQAVSENQYVRTRNELLDNICVALAGRTAENLVLGDISSGCWNDLQQATQVARMMVEAWGMSEGLGTRAYREWTDGAAAEGKRQLSESMAAEVDREIDALIRNQQERCEEVLTTYRDELDRLTQILLDEKVLGLDDLKRIFDNKSFKLRAPEEAEGDESDEATTDSGGGDEEEARQAAGE